MIERLDIQYPNLSRSVPRCEYYAVRARSERHALGIEDRLITTFRRLSMGWANCRRSQSQLYW